jgi:hypothetical protein
MNGEMGNGYRVFMECRCRWVKNLKIKIYNFPHGFLWVWNLVADTEGGMQAEGVEESIWT